MMSSKLSRKVMKMAWQGWWMLCLLEGLTLSNVSFWLGHFVLIVSSLQQIYYFLYGKLLFTFVVGDDDIVSEPMTRVTISLVAMMSSKLSRKVMKMAWQGWWMVDLNLQPALQLHFWDNLKFFSLDLDIDVEDEVHKDFLRAASVMERAYDKLGSLQVHEHHLQLFKVLLTALSSTMFKDI
ncbi:hypothetical protein E3N88_03363 [Mikania micrantha]|uniref:Uncharacterized protein n=1 Tax=Mikania micrantha TaxID=192012 RepID=A0A5N6Q8Y5_9ASTR|nr:hypothetical protein E3N88_03363 [Mikania micrantha]